MSELGEFDVVVAGGGPGGFAAAVASARQGAKTILLEREGCLGGGATTMMVNPFMPHVTGEGPYESKTVVNAGIFRDVCRRLQGRGRATDESSIMFDDEYLKIVLDEMAMEAGVQVIFHAALYDVKKRGRKVKTAYFAHNSGPMEVNGTVFVDGTGDGLLAARAGAEFHFGNEDGLVMPMTTKFVVAGVDTKRMPSWQQHWDLISKGSEDTPKLINTHMSTYRVRPHGRVHFNAIRVPGNTLDPVDLSRAEMEGRMRVENFVAWLKARAPGYENCYLEKMASHIGVRESRRVVGEYTLTYEDWKNCARFDDAIARCSYGIDVHGQKPLETNLQHLKPGEYYQIPYRCLVPKDLGNVLIAGRCISGDRFAHSSYRIMPTVMCIGQAAGAAAALSLPDGDVHRVAVKKVQKVIEDTGGLI